MDLALDVGLGNSQGTVSMLLCDALPPALGSSPSFFKSPRAFAPSRSLHSEPDKAGHEIPH